MCFLMAILLAISLPYPAPWTRVSARLAGLVVGQRRLFRPVILRAFAWSNALPLLAALICRMRFS